MSYLTDRRNLNKIDKINRTAAARMKEIDAQAAPLINESKVAAAQEKANAWLSQFCYVPPVTRPLTFEHVKAFLPTMEAAEAKLDAEINRPVSEMTNESVLKAFEDYYAVVEEGIVALHKDTADRNSLSTLQSAYRRKDQFVKILRKFIGDK